MKTNTKAVLAVLSVLIFFVAGCRNEKEATQSDSPNEIKKKSVADYRVLPTEAECHEFVRRMERYFEEKDIHACHSLVDYDSFYRNSVKLVDTTEEEKKKYVYFKKKLAPDGTGVLGWMASSYDEDSYLDTLRVKKTGNVQSVMVRWIIDESTVDYLEIFLTKLPSGKVQLVDYRLYSIGEKMSLRNARWFAYSQSVHNQPETGNQKAAKSKQLETFNRLKFILESPECQKYERFMEEYSKLDGRAQKMKMILRRRVDLAMDHDIELYQVAVKDYIYSYPNDTASDLLKVNLAFLEEDYSKAISIYNQIEKKVGRDPFLSVLRADSWNQLKRWEEAEKEIEQAYRDEPDLSDLYETAIVSAVGRQDFQKAVDWFKRFEKQYPDLTDSYIEIFETDEYYEDLINSDPFKEWKRSRSKNQVPKVKGNQKGLETN